LGKAEDKRAAIIAQQEARERARVTAEEGAAAPPPGQRRMNWAATGPVRPRRGRPPKSPYRP